MKYQLCEDKTEEVLTTLEEMPFIPRVGERVYSFHEAIQGVVKRVEYFQNINKEWTVEIYLGEIEKDE